MYTPQDPKDKPIDLSAGVKRDVKPQPKPVVIAPGIIQKPDGKLETDIKRD